MKKNLKTISFILFWFSIFFVYRNWFLASTIVGGDWPHFYQEAVNSFSALPPVWSAPHGNGLGGKIVFYALDSYLYSVGWFFSQMLHIPWVLVYKIFYFSMFLFGSLFSTWYLLKKIFLSLPLFYKLIGMFLYVANTYILLVVSGGQMGIALGYSIAPLVLLSFIRIADCGFQIKSVMRNAKLINLGIISGVLFAVQFGFDLRLAYITIVAVIIYLFIYYALRIADYSKLVIANDGLRITGYRLRIKFAIRNSQLTNWGIIYIFIIPLIITGLLHAFWLFPLLFTGTGYIEQQHGAFYTSAGAVKFFSFATFENALGLLHPNWPENIFGKVGFMKAEFLILPILAYSSLLFVNSPIANYALRISKRNNLTITDYGLRIGTKKNLRIANGGLRIKSEMRNAQSTNRIIIFFALLGLVGAFLAKGANEPFGFVYIWLFEHVPGFVMFRDPTKFYLLIALAYSVLIPFSVYSIYEWLREKTDNREQKTKNR